jgi:hypothetical protein
LQRPRNVAFNFNHEEHGELKEKIQFKISVRSVAKLPFFLKGGWWRYFRFQIFDKNANSYFIKWGFIVKKKVLLNHFYAFPYSRAFKTLFAESVITVPGPNTPTTPAL